MKKYLILTSVMVLAACSFGNSNSGGTAPVNAPRAATLINSSASDNSEITSMASAVIVKNDGSYSDVARSASAPNATLFDGYTVYKLDNVDFKLIEDTDSAFNFSVDENGRITSVTAKLGGVEGTAARDTENTKRFNGKIFQFVDGNSDREIITIVDNGSMTQEDLDAVKTSAVESGKITSAQAASGHWNHLDQYWEFEHSNSADGLTYSDFGYMKTTNILKQKDITIDEDGQIVVNGETSDRANESRLVFAGGYDVPNAPTDGMEFTGKAVGVLASSVLTNGPHYKQVYEHSYNTNGDYYNPDEMIALTTDAAHLTFHEGNEVLVLPFGSSGTATDVESGDGVDWYDVTVTKTASGTTFAFDSGDRDIPTRFRQDTGTITPNISQSSMGYYGVNTPTEATGTVEYMYKKELTHEDPDEAGVREFHFQSGYGLKAD